MTERDLLIEYGYIWVGKWYKWGGENPAGFDCSGYWQEGVKSVSYKLYPFADGTAHHMLRYYSRNGCLVPEPYKGCAAFWVNSNGRATHIEMCVDAVRSLGASGGGSATKTVEDAMRHNAFIKRRQIFDRPGERRSLKFADPFKLLEEVA